MFQIFKSLLILPFFLAPGLAFAQEQVPQPSFMEVIARMVPLFIIIFCIFYFMVIKPQEKRLKAQQALHESLKKGDTVVTTGGIIGRVAGIDKDHILLELGGNARLKVESSHIVKRYEKPKDKDKNIKSVA